MKPPLQLNTETQLLNKTTEWNVAEVPQDLWNGTGSEMGP